MRSRRLPSIWRSVLVLVVSLVGVVPVSGDPIGADPAHDRACHGRRDALAPAVARDMGDSGQGTLVRGFGCGTASLDFSGSPQVATSEGVIVLSRIGRGEYTTTLDVVIVTPSQSSLVGTFTLTTRRGSITFSSVGTGTTIIPEVGQTATVRNTLTAVEGTGAYAGVTGTLEMVTIAVVTEVPDPGGLVLLDVDFVIIGTLTFAGR
jgi:hypothetical protein